MDEFLKYWDGVFAYWVEHGSMPPSESIWNVGSLALYPELMPEPYIGDPAKSSLVIMNYNPGTPVYNLSNEQGRARYQNDIVHHSGLDDPGRMCHHYARNYRERVAPGGYLDPTYDTGVLSQGGKDWWKDRLQWIKDLVPESSKLPFAFELCAWHSNKWSGVKYTGALLAALRERLAPAIDEAVRNSDLGIGLCVGTQWGGKILPAFGYRNVTAELMDIADYRSGWKPLGGQRCYAILRNDRDTYIINTWLSKGFKKMAVPKTEYRPIEKEIIKRIKAQK